MKSTPRTSTPHGTPLAYLRDCLGCESGWPLAPVVAWIVEEGRCIAKPADFVARLCSKLVEAGAPAWRLGLDVATIHPRAMAWQLTWTRADGRLDERTVGYGTREIAPCRASSAQ